MTSEGNINIHIPFSYSQTSEKCRKKSLVVENVKCGDCICITCDTKNETLLKFQFEATNEKYEFLTTLVFEISFDFDNSELSIKVLD